MISFEGGAMTSKGRIRNGSVVLDDPLALPEGAEVTVACDDLEQNRRDDGESGPTLYERLKPMFGIANDLPPDGSRNLDHYLYGSPKS
jgi:hypothetical protein